MELPVSHKIAYPTARLLIGVQNLILSSFRHIFFRRTTSAPKNILVLRSAAIGDFVCVLPALYLLRKRFPKSRITLLTTPTATPKYWKIVREAGGTFLASSRLVDGKIVFYGPELINFSKFRELRRRVRSINPDMVFLLPFSGEPFINRLKKILFLRVLGANRNLYGYRMRKSLAFFRRAQFVREAFPHQVVAAIEAINEGCNGTAGAEVVFCIDSPEEDTRRVDQMWEQHSLHHKNPIIGVFPGGRFEHKRWPLDKFRSLCRALIENFEADIVVVGGLEEESLGAALREACGGNLHNFAGQTNLLQTIEILRRCNLYVGNDSGPAHLAAAVGTPCITIFSSVVFPGIWEPWGERNTAIRHRVPCEYCFSERYCPVGSMECIKGIAVEEVLKACRRYLGPQVLPDFHHRPGLGGRETLRSHRGLQND